MKRFVIVVCGLLVSVGFLIVLVEVQSRADGRAFVRLERDAFERALRERQAEIRAQAATIDNLRRTNEKQALEVERLSQIAAACGQAPSGRSW